MKKILLFLAIVSSFAVSSMAHSASWIRDSRSQVRSTAAAASADEFLVFGYCKGYSSALTQGAGTYKAAIQVPASTAATWKGAKVTRVRIGVGRMSARQLTVYFSRTLMDNPSYSQDAPITVQEGWNEIELTTPFTIDGNGFYAGYQVRANQGDYPIGIDDVPTANRMADNVSYAGVWDHIGAAYGSVCIQLVIEGDNLPKYNLALSELEMTSNVKPGQKFPAKAIVSNNGSVVANEFMLNYTVGNGQNATATFRMPEPLAQGVSAQFVIEGISTDEEGINLPLNISVGSVNGEAAEKTESSEITGWLSCVKDGYKKAFVVEEWTGTWCGNCPLGIVGMDYMKEKYGDDGFIGIAVHQGDEMQVSSYMSFLQEYEPYGFPGCIVNRSKIMMPSKAELEAYYTETKDVESFADIDVKASYDPATPREMNVEATVRFKLPYEGDDFRLAFVATEDHLGPYTQTNYFSGLNADYGGWEKKGAYVNWYFDEVARIIKDCDGIAESLPATFEADKEYTYATTLRTAYINDIDKSDIIVLLLNGKTGEISNAAKFHMFDYTSVGKVAESDVRILPLRGGLKIEGEYADCSVYTLDGQLAAKASGAETVGLNAGMYVVRVADAAGNVTVRKVVI